MSGYEIQLFMKDTGWRDGVSRERVCKGESGWQATMERMWGASKTRILTAITWEGGCRATLQSISANLPSIPKEKNISKRNNRAESNGNNNCNTKNGGQAQTRQTNHSANKTKKLWLPATCSVFICMSINTGSFMLLGDQFLKNKLFLVLMTMNPFLMKYIPQ